MIGYVCATASVESICLRFGHRAIAVLCPIVRLLAALLLSAEPAFGVTLIAYAGLGFGSGLTDTAWNTWASGMKRPNVLQGLLHGSFSLGCILGPICVVALLRQYEWSSFYLVIVGSCQALAIDSADVPAQALLSVVELLTQGFAFRHDTAAIYIQHHHHSSPVFLHSSDDGETASNKPTHLLRQPIIYISGAFYILYMAVEATFTGWIVVFMLRARHAPSSTAALASSTFWLGMTAGRYILGLVTERFGVGKAVGAYIVLTLALQVLLNMIRDVNVILVLLAANGAFIAPLFPSGIVLLVSRLQAHMHMRAVALLITLGQVGGALTQLAVGFMADSLGIKHLFEVVCGISALMLVAWMVFARAK